MKKIISFFSLLILLFATINSSFANEKKEVTIFFSLSESKGETRVGNSLICDERDKFSCDILNIAWPQDQNSKVWCVRCFRYQIAEKKYSGPMTLARFKDNIKNPFVVPELDGSFNFPEALPDEFVQKLVQQKTIQQETPKATVKFVLENTDDSLVRLGLIQQVFIPDNKLLPSFVSGAITQRDDTKENIYDYRALRSFVSDVGLHQADNTEAHVCDNRDKALCRSFLTSIFYVAGASMLIGLLMMRLG